VERLPSDVNADRPSGSCHARLSDRGTTHEFANGRARVATASRLSYKTVRKLENQRRKIVPESVRRVPVPTIRQLLPARAAQASHRDKM